MPAITRMNLFGCTSAAYSKDAFKGKVAQVVTRFGLGPVPRQRKEQEIEERIEVIAEEIGEILQQPVMPRPGKVQLVIPPYVQPKIEQLKKDTGLTDAEIIILLNLL